MTNNSIRAKPLTAIAFQPFGDVLDNSGIPDMLINQDMCERYHNRANLDFGPNGKCAISIFDAKPRSLPYKLYMMERHPLGSQAFIPMHENPFLIITANDDNGKPGTIQAFLTAPGQAINFHRNIWHGVLTPLTSPGLFSVIDRIPSKNNLQEYWFDKPIEIS